LPRIQKIINKHIKFYEGDISDTNLLDKIFSENEIYAVLHFAGLKSVNESIKNPSLYIENNLDSSKILYKTMDKFGVCKLIFSSSATIYSNKSKSPITEDSILQPNNPYGESKLLNEEHLYGSYNLGNHSHNNWQIVALRYFNPIGAHSSGLIGENPLGNPDNIMPIINQVAVGKHNEVKIFGNDYPTIDGTGVRDYIHVLDLVDGHIQALEYISCTDNKIFEKINLGNGSGISVLQLINKYQEVTKQHIKYSFAPRRPGDIAESFADISKAKKILHWEPKLSLNSMIKDSWNWQKNNPTGY
tara:strand:- start:3699 stop:4604 length:906 start_codon:yes stop_codon:yes gene_type:complete